MPGDNAQALARTMEGAGQLGSWWKDIPVPLFSAKAAGLTLTGATTPVVATVTGRDIIRWAAADVDPLTIYLTIPGDYDQDRDGLDLFLNILKSTAGDTTATINAEALLARDTTGELAIDETGGLPSAVVSSGAVTIANESTPEWHRISFDTLRYSTAKTEPFRPGDSIQFDIVPGTHATAVHDLYGIFVRYKGCASLWDPTERYAR